MIKTFTQDDVVRYIYGETSEEENAEMLNSFLFDDDLAKTYANLSEVVSGLSHAEKAPSDKTVDNILSYSKSYHLHSVE